MRISFALPSARERPLLCGEDANSSNATGEPPHCGVLHRRVRTQTCAYIQQFAKDTVAQVMPIFENENRRSSTREKSVKKSRYYVVVPAFFGDPSESRTPDTMIKSHVLCHLS